MIRLTLFVLSLCLAVLLARDSFLAAWLCVFLVGNLLARPCKRLAVTLTVSEILTDVLDAFKTKLPAINYFSTDFSNDQVKYNQAIIAHIPSVPTTYDHSTANGYNNNAQDARGLLTDVTVTMNKWRDVPIKLADSDVSQDRSRNYLKTIGNAGYALAKYVVDTVLGGVTSANLTNFVTETIPNTSRDTLRKVRTIANKTMLMGTPRYGLINSDVAGMLDIDPRIASKFFYGQESTDNPYQVWENVGGFNQISEYPAFPDNGQNLTGFFFDPRAVCVASRLPLDSTNLAQEMGIPITYKQEIIQDPATGLALQGFSWIDQNTHIIYIVVTIMFGFSVGCNGGAAGTITDNAGLRLVSGA